LFGLELIQMAKMFLWFFYLINNIKTERQLKIIVGALVASIAFHILLALLEKFAGTTLGLSEIGEINKILLEPVGGKMLARIGGIMPHPIILGSFLALTLPFALGVLLTWKNKLIIWLSGASIIAGLIALVFTLARGAIIGWVVGFLLMLFLAKRGNFLGKRAKYLIISSLILLLIGLLFSPILYQRFFASRPSNVAARYALNKVALNMIKAHPLGRY
jgi:hypothetical protein